MDFRQVLNEASDYKETLRALRKIQRNGGDVRDFLPQVRLKMRKRYTRRKAEKMYLKICEKFFSIPRVGGIRENTPSRGGGREFTHYSKNNAKKPFRAF